MAWVFRPFRSNACQLVALASCLLSIYFIDIVDKRYKLNQQADGRFRHHAIPVVISEMRYGSPHDYTGFKNVAFSFMRPGAELQELVDQACGDTFDPGKDVYYWNGDDRGLADYVLLSFRLFGKNLLGFQKLYYLIILASLLFFFIGYWRDLPALGLATLTVLGLYLLTILFAFQGQLPDHYRLYVISPAYEPRAFEALGYLAFLHMAFFVWRCHSWSWLRLITFLPQLAVFLFLFHARSSMGWQLLAIFFLAGVRLLPLLQAVVGRLNWKTAAPRFAAPLVGIALVSAGLVGLNQYIRSTYHPAYFSHAGVRVFYHNALMGFEYNPYLKDKHNLLIDDSRIVQFVLEKMREENDPRLTKDWDLHYIQCSMGGFTIFDWTTYETVTKELYWKIWEQDPRQCLQTYFVIKPTKLLTVTKDLASFLAAAKNVTPALGRREMLVPILAALFASLLCFRRSVQGFSSCFFPLLVILLLAAIPGVAFYIKVPVISGFLLSMLLGCVLVTECTSLALLAGLVWIGKAIHARVLGAAAWGTPAATVDSSFMDKVGENLPDPLPEQIRAA